MTAKKGPLNGVDVFLPHSCHWHGVRRDRKLRLWAIQSGYRIMRFMWPIRCAVRKGLGGMGYGLAMMRICRSDACTPYATRVSSRPCWMKRARLSQLCWVMTPAAASLQTSFMCTWH